MNTSSPGQLLSHNSFSSALYILWIHTYLSETLVKSTVSETETVIAFLNCSVFINKLNRDVYFPMSPILTSDISVCMMQGWAYWDFDWKTSLKTTQAHLTEAKTHSEHPCPAYSAPWGNNQEVHVHNNQPLRPGWKRPACQSAQTPAYWLETK